MAFQKKKTYRTKIFAIHFYTMMFNWIICSKCDIANRLLFSTKMIELCFLNANVLLSVNNLLVKWVVKSEENDGN